MTTITGLTADVWKSWNANTETASGQQKQSIPLRRLLREVGGLPPGTRMALNSRIPHTRERQKHAYTRERDKRA